MSIDNTNVIIIFMYNILFFCMNIDALIGVLWNVCWQLGLVINLRGPLSCMLQLPLFGKVTNYNYAICVTVEG
jgi:hypothetical protein